MFSAFLTRVTLFITVFLMAFEPFVPVPKDEKRTDIAPVKNVIFIGSQYKMYAFLDNGQEVKINRTKQDKEVREGDTIWLCWEDEDAYGIREK